VSDLFFNKTIYDVPINFWFNRPEHNYNDSD